MAKKLTPERITAVVALSYLVLIPAGAVYMNARLRRMEDDMVAVVEHVGLPELQPTDALARISERINNFMRR